MNSLTQQRQRDSNHDSSLQAFPTAALVRWRGGGGIVSVPWNSRDSSNMTTPQHQQLTKLLVNVSIERSLGPVQVLIKPEQAVGDLIRSAIEIYVKEKRRPLLKDTDPTFFALHYSQFDLQSLKADEKLINLRSRNFFMCSKPCCSSSSSSFSSPSSSCCEAAITPPSFPLTKF